MCFFKRSGIGILRNFLGDGAESGILTTLGARYGPRWDLGPIRNSHSASASINGPG